MPKVCIFSFRRRPKFSKILLIVFENSPSDHYMLYCLNDFFILRKQMNCIKKYFSLQNVGAKFDH